MLASLGVFEGVYQIVNIFHIKFSPSKPQKILDYGDTWRRNGLGLGGYLKENLSIMVNNEYGKRVKWKNNSQGFRNNYDIREEVDSGVIRVISMGDSFTAGYRIGQEKTFSALLEKYFNNKNDGNKYEVLISCIEEPTTGLFYLSKYGIKFNPHFIILGISLGNDIAQSYVGLDPKGGYILNDETGEIVINPRSEIGFMHGLEKFMIPNECLTERVIAEEGESIKDRSIIYRLPKELLKRYIKKFKGESIVSWYGDKQNPRLFDACNGLGMYIKNPLPEITESYSRLFRILNAFKIVTNKHNIGFIVVLFPQRFQIQKRDWIATIKDYKLKENCFDLLKPNNLIFEFCRKNDIICIDPAYKMTENYNKNGRSLYFPNGDMHFNSLGNAVLYDAIKDRIYEVIYTYRRNFSTSDRLK